MDANTMRTIMYGLFIALAAVAILTAWVNIVVQITKKVITSPKFPVQAWVFIVSLVSTLAVMVVGCSIFNLPILGYYWAVAVFISFVVCYAAMFGYDNLYSQIKQLIKTIGTLFKDLFGGKTE